MPALQPRPRTAGRNGGALEALRPNPQDVDETMQPAEAIRDPSQYRAKGRPTVALDQGRVLAARDDLEALRRLGLDSLAGAMRFAQGTPVRRAGHRCTWRVETPSGVFYVKVHRSIPLRRSLLGSLASPARQEWDNIAALRRAGFDMPEPVAVGETSAVVGVPRQSFLVTREVAGVPLDRFLAGGWPNPGGLSPLRARSRVLRDLAGMIRRFHANGFFHRDLYCGHLIVTADPRWGRPYLIDLARVEQRFPPRRRWLVKDLAALESSAPATVSRTDKLRFLLIYLCKSRLDPVAKRWARAVLRKSRRIRAHAPVHG